MQRRTLKNTIKLAWVELREPKIQNQHMGTLCMVSRKAHLALKKLSWGER